MKKMTQSLLALSLAGTLFGTSGSVLADSFAITNATVHTATEQGVLQNAVVVVRDGVITSVGSAAAGATLDVDNVIDAKGGIVTPGFIGSMNILGLVEVNAVADSSDAWDKKADITFDPSFGYNPKASSIAFTRKGGITRNLVTSSGGEDIHSGQTFVVDLTGDWDSIKATNTAVFVSLGANHEGSRATSIQQLISQLEQVQKSLAKASKDKKANEDAPEPEAADEIIKSLLSGEKPLIVAADRASDILAILKLKQRFNVNLVLVGAADAVLISDQIATANVPVIVDAMRNLPESFDSLHNDLSNAGKLHAAGVKVILSNMGDSHNVYNLRYSAGNAVANGMDYNAAMAALTVNVADTFNIGSGSITVGKPADIVIWTGDPFEFSSQVVKMYIDGKEQSTQSRHDKLRERYTTPSDLPRGYTK
ncbi:MULTISPECIES: amidohydrolase family protein [Pseudomonadati]|uniref:Amidohydrolase family protein n=1 Tax=Shewanella aestuarii TaxID=1028752 RepID=A0ABT0L484_9GAMM|nr:amidohydrolase family protein [Shewanella aestuarii]MCL1118508.1 amidohydrolase family protein [Shewanella aestuarii]GGN82844.1 amidohydrolase [Shewanella aestuarii]